jgi:hypothetical protein
MSRRNFMTCSFESHDGGKKGIAENREENPHNIEESNPTYHRRVETITKLEGH